MYKKFYKFSSNPFDITPDARFFYASKLHKKAYNYLCYGMVKSEGFVVITGNPGLGKSTIAYHLLQQKKGPKLIVAHITSTQINADNLLRMISSAYHMEYEGRSKTGLIRDIEVFLRERDAAGQRCILVVDEAQNLPFESLEELRMLSNIQEGPRALLQTFLLGQNQLVKKLKHSSLVQFRQRIIASLHLNPLGIDETKEYIQFRLTKVGWKADPDISDEAYQYIYKYTEGFPRKINMFCDRLLLSAFIYEAHHIDKAHVEDVKNELSNELSGQFNFDEPTHSVKVVDEKEEVSTQAEVDENNNESGSNKNAKKEIYLARQNENFPDTAYRLADTEKK